MRTRIAGTILSALLGSAVARAGDACGGAQTPCAVPLGIYHAAMPEERRDSPAPALRHAVLFFHGAGGSGASILERTSLLRSFTNAGYVVLGLNGLMRPGNAFGTGWSFRPESPAQRDELAFAHQVLDDAEKRFRIDRERVLVSGFSIGAALVWYLACKEPKLGAAYAPIAGGFWRPLPASCAGPVDLLQSHGWRGRTVPLEGRPLRGGELMQGDIFEGLQLWRKVDGCTAVRPDTFETGAVFWRRSWTNCESGRELSLALHPFDHDEVPKEWAEMARLWFEGRLKVRGEVK